MSFNDELEQLTKQLIERKPYIDNEETTKQALIIPFIQKLGFDVFNPLEVKPEYTSDFGNKKGEKVDYSIHLSGKPIIFIEAKSVNENLSNHSGQLYRYFNATPEVKFGILTNGVHYKFFTDLNQDNIMDQEAFFEFNIENLSYSDMDKIKRFRKENFNTNELVSFAEELVYMSNINMTLQDLFENPSDDFVRFLIKGMNNIRVTNSVLEKFKPLVKKSMQQTMIQFIGQKIANTNEQQIVTTEEKQETVTEIQIEDTKTYTETPTGVITTEEELAFYQLVFDTLKDAGREVSNVIYKDTKSYFTVYNRVITNWFLRLYLDNTNKCFSTRLDYELVKKLCPQFTVKELPTKENSKDRSLVYINSIEDIKELKSLIIACYDEVKE